MCGAWPKSSTGPAGETVDGKGVVVRRNLKDTSGGGHGACLVEYTRTHFIVRTQLGRAVGATAGSPTRPNAYAASAFDEAYGAVL